MLRPAPAPHLLLLEGGLQVRHLRTGLGNLLDTILQPLNAGAQLL